MHPPVHSSPDDFNGDLPHKSDLSKLNPCKPSGIHSHLSRLSEYARQNKLKELSGAIGYICEAVLRIEGFLQGLLGAFDSGIHSHLSHLREFARQNRLKELDTAIRYLDEGECIFDGILRKLLDTMENGQAEDATPVTKTFSFRPKPTGRVRVQINGFPAFEISAQLASVLWPLAQNWGTATDEIVAFKPKAVILERASTGSSAPLPAKRLPSIVNKLREAFAKHGLPKSLIETDRKRGLRLRVLRAAMSQSGSFQAGG